MPSDHGAAHSQSTSAMKPPVIRTRRAAEIFGYQIEKLQLPNHAFPWDRNYVLTMHDLGQLNHSIADDWNKRWDAEQREAVNAIYISIILEGKNT